MADAAVENFDLHVLGAGRAACKSERRKRRGCTVRRVRFRGECLWFRRANFLFRYLSSCFAHVVILLIKTTNQPTVSTHRSTLAPSRPDVTSRTRQCTCRSRQKLKTAPKEIDYVIRASCTSTSEFRFRPCICHLDL